MTVSGREIIAKHGGIEAMLNAWMGALSKRRGFPWHPNGFVQRAERREFRFNRINWPEITDEDSNDGDYEAHDRAYAVAQAELDTECLRYRRIVDADERDVFEHLKHEEFCDTAYWIGLSIWLKDRAGMKCSDCTRRFTKYGELDVHHLTYAHRGREYPDHLWDLIVLCGQCHAKRHGKIRRLASPTGAKEA